MPRMDSKGVQSLTSTKKAPGLEQAGSDKSPKAKRPSAETQVGGEQRAVLVPGNVDQAHFDLLMSFTNIRPGKISEGLRGFFVDGAQQKDLVASVGVNQSMLSRKTKEIIVLNEKISQFVSPAKVPELEPGKVASAHFDFIVSCTNLRGEKLLDALRGHFVEGHLQKSLVASLGVNQALLSRKMREIYEVNERLIRISEYYR